jgi:hypothetical protein
MSRRDRFVSLNTVRLDLSDGDWIEIKERLSYAEAQALGSASLVGLNGRGGYDIDMARFGLKRIETWLTDWSFVDTDGKSVNLTVDAIRNLDPDTATEILTALDNYQAERDADPNDRMLAESPAKTK